MGCVIDTCEVIVVNIVCACGGSEDVSCGEVVRGGDGFVEETSVGTVIVVSLN